MAHTGEWSLCTPWRDPGLARFPRAVAGAAALCKALGSFFRVLHPLCHLPVVMLCELPTLCEPFPSTGRGVVLTHRIVVND